MPKMKMTSAAPARKVLGATAGAGLGGAFAIILIYLLEGFVVRGDIPREVETAIATVLSAFVAYVSGYYVRPAARDSIEPDTVADASAPVAAPAEPEH